MKKICTREEAVKLFGEGAVDCVDRLDPFETNRQGFVDEINCCWLTEWSAGCEVMQTVDCEPIWLEAVYYTPEGLDESLIEWEVDHYVIN